MFLSDRNTTSCPCRARHRAKNGIVPGNLMQEKNPATRASFRSTLMINSKGPTASGSSLHAGSATRSGPRVSSKRPTKALTIYQDLLKDKKPKLHVFLNTSAILRSAEKHSEAISCLQRGTHLYPQEPGTWNNLGNCHLDLGQLTKAIIAYRQSLKLEQSFTDARVI